MATITTIIGPMFSGKTSELIRLVERKRIAGKRSLIIKHTIDNRYNTDNNEKHVVTHSEIRYQKADIIYLSVLDLIFANKILVDKQYDIVAIEEGFFFGSGLSEFCNILANNGIDVIVSTIESSFKQELFANVGDLIAISENVIKLLAVCMSCKKADASFTIRTIESVEEILVGGADIYQSVCRNCLNKIKTPNNN